MHFGRGVIFLVIVVAIQAQEEVIVKISNGPIRGMQSGKIYSFKGIPYAEPPVGEKRFEPVEINREKWSEVRNATENGPLCIQMPHVGFSENMIVTGMEDCLFLTVFTTSIDSDKKLPVIFSIHGGAFMYGTGALVSPETLMQYQEFVFVTFNYRVGVMGFLSTEDEVVPGNMGLKDQVIALKWIKENINIFGGDPTSVTLTGLSAGGASTHLHYFSPQTVGLFHRGFSQSGSALNPWVLTENARKKATTLATHLNCSIQNTKDMINCMKGVPAEDVVRGTKLFFSWLYNPYTVFGPVVEKNTEKAFLPAHPEAILRAGKITDLPWIVSMVDAEGQYPVADFITPTTKLDELNKRWNQLASGLLDYEGTAVHRFHEDIGKKVRDFYLQKDEISMQNIDKLVRMFSDRLYEAGISRSSRLHAQFTSSPNYLIYFSFPSTIGVAEVYSGQRLNGSGHGDDGMIIFDTPFRVLPRTQQEEQIVKQYSDFLIKYASGKNPEMAGVKLKEITNKNNIDFLHIKSPDDITLNTTKGFGNEDFWYSLPIAEWNFK